MSKALGHKQYLRQGNITKVTWKRFKWVDGLSEFDEGFIKSYNGKNKKEYFFEVDVEYPKKFCHFYQKD